MKNVIVLFLILVCFGCTEPVDDTIEQPQGKELVLIYGFISPDEEQIKVAVSQTRSIFDTTLVFDANTANNLVITDAIVTITNEAGEEVQIPFDDSLKRYVTSSSSLLIEPGKQYTLKVLAQGKEFNATCVVPIEKVVDISASLGFRVDDFGDRTENLTIQFKDITATNNFYIVGAQYRQIGAIDFETNTANFGEQRFATDITGDGFPIFSNAVVFDIDAGLEITTRVAHVDEFIYNTLKANYINAVQNNNDNPFFRPVIPPTNIKGEGGYGVFAGFRITEKQEEIMP